MKRALALSVMLTACVALPGLVWAAGETWGTVAVISSTVSNTVGRLCMGVPDTKRPGDIGCPTYAPSLTTAGHVSVTGNLSASKFIGDGSLLTGISGGSAELEITRTLTGNITLTVGVDETYQVVKSGSSTAYYINLNRTGASEGSKFVIVYDLGAATGSTASDNNIWVKTS